VRCMAYVLNFAVQRILKTFKAEALEPDIDMAEAEGWQHIAELSPGAILRKVRWMVCDLRDSARLWEAHFKGRECGALETPPKCSKRRGVEKSGTGAQGS
jgi:hypothetical protein